ncbi:MAG: hypothetical protein KDK25_13300 [Leptospiraceae bacterium]|nr:hypothetical protein [Leptospiraceae bacterium]
MPLVLIAFSGCSPDPADLNKKWVAESVTVKGGADPEFASTIKEGAYIK